MTSLYGKNLSAHIGPKPGNSQPCYLSNVGIDYNFVTDICWDKKLPNFSKVSSENFTSKDMFFNITQKVLAFCTKIC